MQNLSEGQASKVLLFYLKGAATVFYEGLPPEAQDNLQTVIRLLEARFDNKEEDDLLMAQQPNENVQDYIDRVILKANHQEFPQNLVIKIARKGFHPSLKQIKRDPKSIDELKQAAVIAEKCLESKFIKLHM